MKHKIKYWPKPVMINCAGMKTPPEILVQFRKLKIEKFPYAIFHDNVLIKYGASAPTTRNTEPGERVYRQVGRLLSFGKHRLTGPNSKEFAITDEKYQDLYGSPLNHNNIRVHVWPMDDYEFETINHWTEVNWAEQELISNHLKFYGELPIGNLDDGSLMNRKSSPLKSVTDKMFLFTGNY
jgi:hypothetical protein